MVLQNLITIVNIIFKEGPAGADDDYDSNDGGHFSPVGETELFGESTFYNLTRYFTDMSMMILADPVVGDGDHEIGGLFEDPVTHEDAPSIGQPDKQIEPVQPGNLVGRFLTFSF